MPMDLVARLEAALAIDEVESLAGGHQSRVFRGVGPHGRVVVKVQDASLTNRVDLDTRLDVVAALADLDPRVCRPLSFGETRVIELRSGGVVDHYVTGFEFAVGRTPDPGRGPDAEAMGTALARLHEAMRRLPPTPLPPVAALDTISEEHLTALGPIQLLHGDFNADNLRVAEGTLRIFDFDDCGYGPAVFDVANALYMVLFDARTSARPGIDLFRRRFVSGYEAESRATFSADDLDQLIDLRVDALARWLADPSRAPAGIRTASPGWLATLRAFVLDHRARR